MPTQLMDVVSQKANPPTQFRLVVQSDDILNHPWSEGRISANLNLTHSPSWQSKGKKDTNTINMNMNKN